MLRLVASDGACDLILCIFLQIIPVSLGEGQFIIWPVVCFQLGYPMMYRLRGDLLLDVHVLMGTGAELSSTLFGELPLQATWSLTYLRCDLSR